MGITAPAHLRPPFPWIGGKSRVSHLITRALGIDAAPAQIYVEPFAGGLGVLLSMECAAKLELVSDTNAMIANFWRAVRHQPEAVAVWADRPAVELELGPTWDYLGRCDLAPPLADLDYPGDAKAAGLWAWSRCNSIGHTGNRCLHVGTAGQGLMGLTFGTSAEHQPRDVQQGMRWLAHRLRNVRVIHGDWKRAIQRATGARQDARTRAFFLDPPYRGFASLYDCAEFDHDAMAAWAQDAAKNPKTRIVLAGHAGDYTLEGWRMHVWERQPGLNGSKNRQECLWMSPACRPLERAQLTLL